MRSSDWSSDVCSSDLLVAGCFYALTAVGLTLIFGMMQIVNFAHGEFFVLGGMLAYVLTHFLGIPFAAAIPIVLVVMWIFGAFVDWALLSRMRDAPMISTALVTKIGRASCRERVCQYV